jgi:4-alpha-glucanotransferase
MHFKRSSGILLHPTSLPGAYGIGTLGEEAFDFIDFLEDAGQSLWQICPLGPTGYGDSPYQCFSAFAGNPLLISIEKLQKQDLLSRKDINKPSFSSHYVDFGSAIKWKMPVLRKAYRAFTASGGSNTSEYQNFCQKHACWLNDYALFIAIKSHLGGKPWSEWEEALKMKDETILSTYRGKLADEIAFQTFLQYIFFCQWLTIKQYANEKKITIIGDIPFYVAHDSADAWARPDIFHFDEQRNPSSVAGVPPDYFSETGQLWGNPLYNWNVLQEQNFSWWLDRIKANLELADILRIDHFRALSEYWAVPAGEETAINGKWVKAPGYAFLEAVRNEFSRLPIIAEDLGLITPEVTRLREHFKLPGMKILQFAFGADEDHEYLPENYKDSNCVVYTGTHDNNTTRGWYEEADEALQHEVRVYTATHGDDVSWDLMNVAWKSKADIAIAPLQDVLGLGAEARMNTPGQAYDNWTWRFTREALNEGITERLKNMTRHHGR